MLSQAAYPRECRTLAKHYLKGNEKEAQAFIKLHTVRVFMSKRC
ncbi:hypothetical protein NEOC65_001612 [Neochlamydia sp. AcF65]|nr:hypothetical protein [Neochlamydia sp. AcF65]MBS4170051.1 hypothetical protein [Neochlamydia sp. AcF95]